MRPRKKDPSFLYMGSLAALGGSLAIGLSSGVPLWQYYHGQGFNPAFTFFGLWGIAALMGAFACFSTYRLSDTVPPKPPGGGVRLEFRRNADTGTPNASTAPKPAQRRAA